MARQVLTLPDVPSTLLTKTAADGFYLPLSHAPGTDPHTQYHNDTRGDVRYYTKTLGDARYAPTVHNHDAAYAPTVHNHDAAYINTVGNDSMAGSLGIGVTPQAWGSGSVALQVGDGASIYAFGGTANATLWLASNSYISGSGDKPIIGGQAAARFQITAGQVDVQFAPSVAAGVAHTFTSRTYFTNTGGIVQIGAAGGEAGHYIRGADDQWKHVQFQRTDGLGRLLLGSSPTSNNLELHTYADDGSYVGRAFAIPRGSRRFISDAGVEFPANVGNYWPTNTSILSDASGNLQYVAGSAHMWNFPGGNPIYFTNGNFYPASHRSTNLGLPSYRFNDIYGWTCQAENQMYSPQYSGINGQNVTLYTTNNIALSAAGGYIHPHADNVVNLGHPGIRWTNGFFVNIQVDSQIYCPGANIICGSTGGQYIQTNYHQFVKGGGGHIQVAGAGNFEPATDNSCLLGGNANRWQSVWSNNGGIQTSHVSMKKNFVPLDPGECAAAVLSTDWLHFDYLEPEMQPAAKMETPDQRKGRYEDFARLLVETAPARNQKGYVLESPNHNTHALFGLNDRKSSSPSSDLAVVAAALQFALREIAQLKEELAARG